MDKRDYQDPRYKKWRKAVFVRDKFKCQMPGCPGTSKYLNAHHIRCWAHYPTLRFVVANGITLCRFCHGSIHGQEEEWVATFSKLIPSDGSEVALGLLFLRYDEKDKK